jgi:hypothetical protein
MDCQFEIGPAKVKLAFNRAWIASKSCTPGSIQVDPNSIISIPLFTFEAFKLFVDRLEEVGDVSWYGRDIPYKPVSLDV